MVAVAARSGLGPGVAGGRWERRGRAGALEAAGGRSAGGRMDQGGAHGCRGRHVLLSQSHGSGIRAAAAAAPTAGGRGSGTAQEANPPPPPPAAGRAERAGLGGGRRCHSPRGARAPEPGGKGGGGARLRHRCPPGSRRRRPHGPARCPALPCGPGAARPAQPARRGCCITQACAGARGRGRKRVAGKGRGLRGGGGLGRAAGASAVRCVCGAVRHGSPRPALSAAIAAEGVPRLGAGRAQIRAAASPWVGRGSAAAATQGRGLPAPVARGLGSPPSRGRASAARCAGLAAPSGGAARALAAAIGQRYLRPVLASRSPAVSAARAA